jgi:hypothetical protein
MADYYPLIAKAVSGLEKSTGEARRALYDRARSALVAQLRGVTPALSESDITRERLSLEEAIRKVETEAARRSRTDPPPRSASAAPPPRPAPAELAQPPQPPLETVEMRPTPPQIRVSPPAAPTEPEPVHAEEDDGETEGASVEPEAPAPPERPRWSPGGGGPSISDRGLKGFRDVVADGGDTLGGISAQAAAKSARASPGLIEPPPASAFEQAEPPVETEPLRPSARRPTPRDAERVLTRAPEPVVRAREPREPRRSRDSNVPRPSSRRLEPPPASAPFGAPADGPATSAPDLDDVELTRPPSSIVRQEDVPRRPSTPRAPQPEKRREKRVDKRPEPRPEPRTERRDEKRFDRWAERPPEKKKTGLAALPLRKITLWTVVALIALAGVGFVIWNPPTGIISLFRGGSSNLPRPAENRDNGVRPKIADRIGGPSSSPSADEGTLVAQKVVLYEEDPNDPAGKRYVGSAVWRTESVPPAPGQPPDIAVRADIEIPEQKISARWSLRRNDDKSLPASHTIEINFNLPGEFAHGGITNIPGVLMKQSESTRGVPLAGLAVKVTTNFFLIGLQSGDTDRTRNIQLLKERGWFDIPVVYNDGRRAIIAIEKGTPGDRAFARAFEAWGQ